VQLPNAHLAVVPERKVTHYLLNPSHPAGGSKALFLLRFGFSATEWQALAAALVTLAREHEVLETTATPFGRRYVVDGQIVAPDGTRLHIRTAWFIETNSNAPRFVTAHPLPK
jgi:hypothetical protein